MVVTVSLPVAQNNTPTKRASMKLDGQDERDELQHAGTGYGQKRDCLISKTNTKQNKTKLS
jgi:hypothetical protein